MLGLEDCASFARSVRENLGLSVSGSLPLANPTFHNWVQVPGGRMDAHMRPLFGDNVITRGDNRIIIDLGRVYKEHFHCRKDSI